MSNDRGTALVLAVVGVFLTAALSASLAILTATELRIAANVTMAMSMRYAAEAGLEVAVLETLAHPDWNALVTGASVSAFSDGAPGGTRVLSDGAILDLDDQTGRMRTADPTRRLFAFGPLSLLGAGDSIPSAYIAVWIAAGPVPDVLWIHAAAFGPGTSRKAVETMVSRAIPGGPRVLFWQEVR